jgi:hydrogenase maturation protein HypF
MFEIFGDELWERGDLPGDFSEPEMRLLRRMLSRRFNAPLTSSAGRLFDAVASLIGLRQRASFEGQAAMDLEFAVDPGIAEDYPFAIRDGAPHIIDWQPMMLEMMHDILRRTDIRVISTRFHNTLAEIIVSMAARAGEPDVILTGGCFQNRYLTERAVERLQASGFLPHWHQRIPPNDGGIAPGQIIATARAMRP